MNPITRASAPLLALWAATVLAAAIFPFEFGYGGPRRAANGASTRGERTLEFDGPSYVRTPGPPGWGDDAIEAETLVVAFEARTARPGQHGPARLVTWSNGAYERNFTIAQKGVDLVVRARRAASDENGAPPLKVDAVFDEIAWRTFEVRFGARVIEILIDGTPRYRDVQESSPFELWDPSFQVAVGDEVDGARGWDGALRNLVFTVADVVFDPLASDSEGQDASGGSFFEIPGHLWHVPEAARRLVRFDPSHAALTAAAHFTAFLPLGALFFLRGRRSVGRTFGAGLLGGVFLQLVKLFFVGRHPSLYHAIPNGLGAVAGLWIAALWAGRTR